MTFFCPILHPHLFVRGVGSPTAPSQPMLPHADKEISLLLHASSFFGDGERVAELQQEQLLARHDGEIRGIPSLSSAPSLAIWVN